MGGVRSGIQLIYWGLVCLLLTVIGTVGAVVVGRGSEMSARIAMAAGIAALIGAGLISIGRLLCVGTPQESGAREYILVAVYLDGVTMLIVLAQFFAPRLNSFEAPMAAVLFSHVSAVLFLLFLRQLGVYLRREDLAQKGTAVLRITVMAMGTSILMIGLQDFWVGFGVILGLTLLIVSIVLLLSFCNLISTLHTALKQSN